MMFPNGLPDPDALRRGYRLGTFTPLDVTEFSLSRAGACPGLSPADPQKALALALASNQRWTGRVPLSALDGVPVSFEDCFSLQGLSDRQDLSGLFGPPADHDSLVVRRAVDVGLIPICRTAPQGAGDAVLSGAARLGLGNDQAGALSVQVAQSGLCSLKPTRGRIAWPAATSTGTPALIATGTEVIELTLAALGRYDDSDPFAAEGAYRPGRSPEPAGQRIALWRSPGCGQAADPDTLMAVDHAADLLEAAGAQVVDLPDLPLSPGDYEALFWARLLQAGGAYFARSSAEREQLPPEVTQQFDPLLGKSALFAAYIQNRLLQTGQRLTEALSRFDFVLSPARPQHHSAASDAWSSKDSQDHIFTSWFNQLGWPAAIVPVLDPADGRGPVAVQIAGKRFNDAGVLALARSLETARGFDLPLTPRG